MQCLEGKMVELKDAGPATPPDGIPVQLNGTFIVDEYCDADPVEGWAASYILVPVAGKDRLNEINWVIKREDFHKGLVNA
jgi:hypothetical protein